MCSRSSHKTCVRFKDFYPGIPSYNYMFMLEAMTYKISLEIARHCSLEASDIVVQAWTNQYDKDNSDGNWHPITLDYCGSRDDGIHHYGESVIITSAWDFKFTYRMKVPGNDWVWSHGWQEDGFAHVEPPRDYDQWTQGPDYDHILGSVHLGNFIAATNAKSCGFSHVLNVADNLDMVYPEGDVSYCKVAMTDGAHNPIEDYKIQEAVDWLLANDDPTNKILINCRAGIGRAGSVAVAFVFACKPQITYEEAYEFVYQKRFVYPHKHLKDILYRLYPRRS